MWYLEKVCHISSSHRLNNYDGPCANLHGHNWKITVRCKGDELDKTGMLVDFRVIKDTLRVLDHTDLNILYPDVNPTAELLALKIQGAIPYCYEVEVEETEGSKVIYRAN